MPRQTDRDLSKVRLRDLYLLDEVVDYWYWHDVDAGKHEADPEMRRLNSAHNPQEHLRLVGCASAPGTPKRLHDKYQLSGGFSLACDYRFTVDDPHPDLQGLPVTITVRVVDGKVGASAVAVAGGGRPFVTGRALRSIPVDSYIQLSMERFARHVLGFHTHRRPDGGRHFALANPRELLAAQPAQQLDPADRLRYVADLYNEATSSPATSVRRAPVQYVMGKIGYSRQQTTRFIRQARDEGLIP